MSLPTEQHFKCDCVYPCEHYPHCGGHKITFSNLEHFILKEDGKIYWIEKMPDSSDFVDTDDNITGTYDNDGYEKALQSAIDSAVEVSNQEEVQNRVFDLCNLPKNEHGGRIWKFNTVYSLLCWVEKKEFCASDICDTDGQCEHCREPKTLALVTLSKPEEKGIEPMPMKAWDPRVLVNGNPVMVDFRIISEELYQKLTRKK